ncbi:sigma 54-interacting transcriptional regulator [Nitrospira moscoviensis]|uniref:Putative transmembrane signal transduction receptor and sigma-54 dependent response regulator n=1 Tax=Nitrospira moscoviensis TaxID=42253 RepID=A0A0K2G9E2_NITMO|nr:sigma 54-interacting transcriptional regulator [Nitrospira moscoviensis]ALA57227.1 putative transmembrane signal transduction receptor and sigma-54 dependent response regulator [Nitrospira moscoviensis]
MALLAVTLAAALWTWAPVTFTALDHAAYDFWLTHRAPRPVSSSLVIMARDPASDELFGVEALDRALLARLITAIDEAGAAVIGLDHRLDHASPAQSGGAASDALFIETIKNQPALVLTQSTADQPLLSEAVQLGHLRISTDADHVVRAVPAEENGLAAVPPFGLALYRLARRSGAPPATPDTVLVDYAGDGSLQALSPLPLSSVWAAVEAHDGERLTEWFKDKIVVIVPQPPVAMPALLPAGQAAAPLTVHLHLLNMLLTDSRVCSLGMVSRALISFAFTGLIAWTLLLARGPLGWFIAMAGLLAYGSLALGVLAAAHLVLPLAVPLSAALVVMLGTALWNQLTSHERVRLMEQDMLRLQQEAAAVREALVLRETRADTLQEDLQAARAAAAQSAEEQDELMKTADALRRQLTDVQAQEEEARGRLTELERQLQSLRAAVIEPARLNDIELDRLQDECRQLGIVTQDTGLLRLYRDMKKGARAPLTVLLLGEPGTGKELFARAVHRLSPRSGKTFIAVNMAAVSPELFESELFGHTKGSFTGATADRRGYFELANHGTIFLDEIGDLRLDHQSKLLRVLQEKSFYRVGATVPTTVDVRIVAATNRDLQRGVSEGWFREDLYFRLSGLVFRLPPLRERTGDIPVLVERFLADIAAEMGRPAPKLSNDAMQFLEAQEWKGNVRELRQCLEQAVALNETLLLGKEALRLTGDRLTAGDRPKASPLLPEPAGDAAVLDCLRQHEFDMQATAKALGWDRSTVTQRLKGLCFQALVECNGDHAKAALAIAGDASHLRTVELKLMDYYGHLVSVIDPFKSADEAIAECRRRFKNLPDRHFASVDALVRRHLAK